MLLTAMRPSIPAAALHVNVEHYGDGLMVLVTDESQSCGSSIGCDSSWLGGIELKVMVHM